MNPRIVCLLIIHYFNLIGCYSGNRIVTKHGKFQKGVLVFFMNDPYFFSTNVTSIEKISNLNIIGLKIEGIDFKEILKKISQKSKIVVYANGEKKIDTVKCDLGILPVKILTKISQSKLSTDTAAFNFEYSPNKWALLKYEIRYDTEIMVVEPVFSKDIKAFKKAINSLQ